MSNANATKIDKSQWGPGPWQTEPDRKEWKHAGFPCLIVRVASHGGLCGYVAVPPGHPWHGKGYDDVHEMVPDLDVHGGLTYASKCSGQACHVPKPGEPDDVWWLGFDHAHAGDLSPAYYHRFAFCDVGEDIYCDMNYATAGVEALALAASQAA